MIGKTPHGIQVNETQQHFSLMTEVSTSIFLFNGMKMCTYTRVISMFGFLKTGTHTDITCIGFTIALSLYGPVY